MKSIDSSLLTKEIHFPVIRPVLSPTPSRNIFIQMYRFLVFSRRFCLLEHHIFWIPILERFCFIPKTFVYDGASVPKILNFLYMATGLLFYGSLPHDFGYQYAGLLLVNSNSNRIEFEHFTKHELDIIFEQLSAMESGMPIMSKLARIIGLGLPGIIVWKRYRKKNNNWYSDFKQQLKEGEGK
jgi:hypothetical protein